MEPEAKIQLPPLRQLGFVVRDLEATRAQLERNLGLGPFQVFDFDLKGFDADGREISAKIKIGLAEAGGLQVELIQPLRGENLYTEFLAQRGDGLHHLAYEVESFAIVDALERAGARKLLYNDFGAFAFAYLDVPGFGNTPIEFLRMGEEPA